jgi:hypothetical protein
MAVLNTTSPVASPMAPMPEPWNTVPSASARIAGENGEDRGNSRIYIQKRDMNKFCSVP